MKKSMEEFIKEQVEQEDKLLLEYVKNDSATHDIHISKETDEKVLAKVRAYTQFKKQEEQNEFQARYERQQEELERLRRQNRRSIRITRYAIVAAALVLILAVGMTSIGGPDKVFKTLVQTLQGGGTNIKTRVDDGSVEKVEIVDETEAYEKMKKLWGVDVVRITHVPEDTYFESVETSEPLQFAKLIYQKKNQVKIVYHIMLGYQTSSKSMEISDTLISDYTLSVHATEVTLKEYKTKEGNYWMVTFGYNDIQYVLMITDENQESVEKIVKNLFFP